MRLAALIIATACAPAHVDPPPAELPLDVLVVTIDTARWDRFIPNGDDAVPTPTVDALMDRGVTFTQASAPAPTTLVSHTSLWTGQTPPTHGVRNNGSFILPAAATTLAERAQAEGWQTGAFVAANVLAARYGLDQGFEIYDDRVTSTPGSYQVPRRSADSVVDAAATWIDQLDPNRPAMSWVHLYDPHAPYDPPEPEASQYADRLYDGEIAYADRAIGRLLQRLDAAGRLDRTLVVITADHGESLGQHDESTHSIFIYDATVRIPLVFAGPGVPTKQLQNAPVSLIDIAPTIASLAGWPALPAPDGSDLSKHWGPSPPPLAPTYVESLTPQLAYGWAPLRGLRTDTRKLIIGAQPELYDLSADPGEQQNLAAARPAEVANLMQTLNQRYPDSGPVPNTTVDADTRAALEALGYLSASHISDDARGADPRERIHLHTRMEAAIAAENQGDSATALALNRAVLDDDPANLTVAQRIGLLERRAGRLDAAVAAYTTAIALQPDDPQSHIDRASARIAAGETAEACADLLAAHPRPSLELELTRAEACAQANRFDAVATALSDADVLVPVGWTADSGPSEIDSKRAWDAQSAARVGDACWASHQYALASAAYALGSRFAPADPRLAYNQGLAAEKSGQREVAAVAFRRAIALEPGHAGATRHLAGVTTGQ